MDVILELVEVQTNHKRLEMVKLQHNKLQILTQKSAPKFFKPLDPHDFDRSKVSFSNVKTRNADISEIKYVDVQYNGDKLYVYARNCKIMRVKQNETTKLNCFIFKITDENFIKMMESYDTLLNFTGYTNRESWFNDNDISIMAGTMQMLKPTLLYHEIYGYGIVVHTSIQYQNSKQFSEDYLLMEKNNVVDVCFSLNKVYIQENNFYCSTRIEKIQKIKYIGPWSMSIQNETTHNFHNCIMSILLCNNAMNNPLFTNILIYIFEYLQTF